MLLPSTASSASLLKSAMSVRPRMRLVTVPAVIEPLTSIDIGGATRATGLSIADSAIKAANVAPPTLTK